MLLSRRFLAVALVGSTLACGGGGDGGGATGPTTGDITGSVTTGTEAVANATVTLSGPASRTTTTSATGAFTFTDLAPGAYSVVVSLPSTFQLAANQPGTRTATVVAGQTATVSWTAQRATSGGGGNGGGDDLVIVHLSGTSFAPSVIDVAPGTTVRWVVDDGAHTVTPDSRSQTGAWQEASLATGQVFEHKFTTAGQTYQYHCAPHQSFGMVGTVRVGQ